MGKALVLVTLLLANQAQITEEAAKKAEATLALNQDDAAAHLVLGKYLCFQKDDWIVGLPHLAKGSDAALKAAASKDLSEPPKTAPEKVGMGDAWIDAVKKAPAYRKHLQDRACYWYGQAWPDLDGVWKDKLRTRLRAMFQALFTAPKGISTATAWTIVAQDARATRTNSAAHSGTFSYAVSCWAHPLPSYVPISQSVVGLKFGQTCKMSVWVMSDGTDTSSASLRIHIADQAGKFIHIHGVPAPVDQPLWSRIEYSFTVPLEAVTASVDVAVNSRAGVIFLDDFSFTLDGKEQLKNAGFEEK